MSKKISLDNYNNSYYVPGNRLKILIWYFFNILILKNKFLPFSKPRIIIMRLFGAKIGKGVIIKPGVNVKYPWKLQIGDHSWIGENVWIDNLENVKIGSHVCLSQGSMLLCGNHNYKKQSFDLIVKPITIHDGAWVCAKSVVCLGVIMKSHSILSVGSVASKDLNAYGIYRGNPAIKVKDREII